MKKIKIAILFFFAIPWVASASFYPSSFTFPASPDVEQWAFSLGTPFTYRYQSTTTLAGINVLSVDLCRYGAYSGGSLLVDVWRNGTTSPAVSIASSTILVSSLPTGGDCWVNGKKSTSTLIQLNKVFNASSNDFLYIKMSVDDGSATIAQSFFASASDLGSPSFLYQNVPYLSGGKYLNAGYKWGSGLPAYSTSWADAVESARSESCSNLVTCALTWAFFPSGRTLEEFSSITLASSSPFSYLYQMNGYLDTLKNGSATSSKIIVPFMGTDITIFDTANICIMIPSCTTIKDVLGWLIWVLVLFVAYREVQLIFHTSNNDQSL